MDDNEEGVLVSLKEMENSADDDQDYFEEEGNESIENIIIRQQQQCSYSSHSTKQSLPWLNLRVFYVRITKCAVTDDDSAPEFLTLNHVPLNRDTLLEVNGVRTSIYSDGVSILLKRDRLDKKSEEVTFVSTDCIRMSGSVRFEVFCKDDALVLSGTLEPSSKNRGPVWIMNCESDVLNAAGNNGYVKGNFSRVNESVSSPSIEVYVAGSCLNAPIVLSKFLQHSNRKKQTRNKCVLESIPEYEVAQDDERDASSIPALQSRQYSMPISHKSQERHAIPYPSFEYVEGEDGELSWFNAGVRVGVGLGLSICLGVGIGVGILVRTYQGTARPFRKRVL